MHPRFFSAALVFAVLSLIVAVASTVVAWLRLNKVDTQLQSMMAELAEIKVAATIPNATPTIQYLPAATVSSLPTNTTSVASSVADVRALLAQVSQRLDTVESQLNKPAVTTSAPAPKSEAREYVIYLGSGSTDNREWTVISGAGLSLDMSKYHNVREVRFEAGLSIINGEAHARLYNQTTGQPFYTTEVWHNTSSASWKTSSALSLPAGTNYYSVQMRSSSGEMANLVGARLKIIAD